MRDFERQRPQVGDCRLQYVMSIATDRSFYFWLLCTSRPIATCKWKIGWKNENAAVTREKNILRAESEANFAMKPTNSFVSIVSAISFHICAWWQMAMSACIQHNCGRGSYEISYFIKTGRSTVFFLPRPNATRDITTANCTMYGSFAHMRDSTFAIKWTMFVYCTVPSRDSLCLAVFFVHFFTIHFIHFFLLAFRLVSLDFFSTNIVCFIFHLKRLHCTYDCYFGVFIVVYWFIIIGYYYYIFVDSLSLFPSQIFRNRKCRMNCCCISTPQTHFELNWNGRVREIENTERHYFPK